MNHVYIGCLAAWLSACTGLFAWSLSSARPLSFPPRAPCFPRSVFAKSNACMPHRLLHAHPPIDISSQARMLEAPRLCASMLLLLLLLLLMLLRPLRALAGMVSGA